MFRSIARLFGSSGNGALSETVTNESRVHSSLDGPESEQIPDMDDHSDFGIDDEFESVGPSLESVRRSRIAKSVLVLREQINKLAEQRQKSHDGTYGDSRHCNRPRPSSDHCPRVLDRRVGVVTAIDITDDIDNGCDAEAIAESLRDSKDPRIKYIIWARRICSSYDHNDGPAWSWRPYNGSNPHEKHIHLSVKSEKKLYDATNSWDLTKLEQFVASQAKDDETPAV